MSSRDSGGQACLVRAGGSAYPERSSGRYDTKVNLSMGQFHRMSEMTRMELSSGTRGDLGKR
jgi:hypothetical protein